MATQQVATANGIATADTGAQYFTVRDDTFGRQVQSWIAQGVVRQWSTGFAAPDSSGYFDAYPRYCGRAGMAAILAHLSHKVTVRLQSRVAGIDYEHGRQVTLISGERLEAAAGRANPW